MWLFLTAQVIGDVQVEGLKYRPQETAKSYLKAYPGRPFSPLMFRTYVYNFYRAGFLDTLLIYSSRRNDTVDLLIKAVDVPSIVGFDFKIQKVNSKELNDSLLKFYKGLPATDYNLFKLKKELTEFYEKAGYVNTDIRLRTVKAGPAGVRVVVEGNVGEKYRIRKIVFHGNEHIPDHTLRSIMQNRELNFWRKVIRGGWLSMKKLREDIKRIEEFYHDNGYPDAEVDSFRVIYDSRDYMATINIYITEGQKKYFGNVAFEGNEKFSDSTLYGLITFNKPPDILTRAKYRFVYKFPYDSRAYSQKKVMESLQNISGLYADSGYLYVQVNPEEKTRDSVIDITFHIKENWKVKIRKVNIVNNHRTWEEVIRRELFVFPGDYFNRSKLMLSYRNLYYLNYFQNIGIDFKPVPEDSTQVDLVIKVEEKPTGQFGGGASYSQLEGFFVNASIRQPNFMGRGWNLSLLVEYGIYRKNFSLSFTDPWFGGEPTMLGGSIYSTSRYLYTFNQRNTGLSITYGKRLWNVFSKISLRYALEYISVSDISPLYEGTPFYDFWTTHEKILLSSITTTFTYDTRNRIFNASRGFKVEVPWKVAGGPLGGDIGYTKILPEFQIYIPQYRDKIVAWTRINWGSIFSILYPQQIPPDEYFALGDVGYFGLRGYDLRSIGTRVGKTVLGGRHFFRFTFEEHFRVNDQLYLLAFYEAGNAWWSLKTVDFTRLYDAVGVGFRVEVPMLGVMGFDFAYSLKNREWKTHFQMGYY